MMRFRLRLRRMIAKSLDPLALLFTRCATIAFRVGRTTRSGISLMAPTCADSAFRVRRGIQALDELRRPPILGMAWIIASWGPKGVYSDGFRSGIAAPQASASSEG